MASKMSVSVTALRTLPVFQSLDAEKLELVASVAAMRRVTRGTAVVTAGETTDNVYFVLSGNLKVIVCDEEGREVILTIIGQGDVFGEMGVVDDAPRSATVCALSPADLVVISREDFRHILSSNFDVCMRIMCSLAKRLREADRKIESLSLMDVYGRVARLLLDMAEVVDGQKIIRKKVSKQDIAKMIGASREMVSRVMKDLQSRGLILETESGVILIEACSTPAIVEAS